MLEYRETVSGSGEADGPRVKSLLWILFASHLLD